MYARRAVAHGRQFSLSSPSLSDKIDSEGRVVFYCTAREEERIIKLLLMQLPPPDDFFFF